MPIYDYQCNACGYRSSEFVWVTAKDGIVCPRCHNQMIRLFTTSNMFLLNRQKAVPFKFDPHEPSADKSLWKSVISDAEKGKLHPGELKWWKKEIGKTSPNIIL